ncbi:MAG: 2OG-Fe dioxygenase family protein [Oceanospirillaceae bacterium]|nr:2OG-Fe dioxygenase family protein [Oceanospirillaceae bacterium]
MSVDNFYLELGQLSEKSVESLETSFDNLPKSDYLDGAYRLRRFSHFSYAKNQLKILPTKAFSQNADINEFQGNVAREYQNIEAAVVSSSAFDEMFSSFKKMASITDETPIEVHQMRILGQKGAPVEVAPEGVHQDGFDFLAVFVIDRNNIAGGEICVHPAKEQAPIFKHAFNRGEFLVLNDKRFWHSAAALQAVNDDAAYMDVFVLTA